MAATTGSFSRVSISIPGAPLTRLCIRGLRAATVLTAAVGLPRSPISHSDSVRRQAGRGSTRASVSITSLTPSSTALRSVPAATTRCFFPSGWPCRAASHAYRELSHEKITPRRGCAVFVGPGIRGRYADPRSERTFGGPAIYLDQLLSRCTRGRRLRQSGDHRPGAARAGLLSGAPVTTGVTTANRQFDRVVVGGQIGCDYQFAPSWVVGIEGAASGSNMKGDTRVGLPAGAAGETALVTAKTDFIPSVPPVSAMPSTVGCSTSRAVPPGPTTNTASQDRSRVLPSILKASNSRFGWTGGGGVEWAFSGSWSAKLEYDYYLFGHGAVLMSDSTNAVSGPVSTKQSVQIVKAGLDFHMWGDQ